MAKMSPLRRRMIEDMTLRNLSRQTQQSYIYAVAKFSRHFNRPPDRLGMEDVRAYQLHLVGQKYSWAHINQVACALRFFYGVTLSQKEAFQRIITGKDPEKLPPVLDDEEIVRFLEAVEGVRIVSPWRPLMRRACASQKSLASRLPRSTANGCYSTLKLAKVAGIGTRCCRHGFWRFYALIGSARVLPCGCFQGRNLAIISASPLSRAHAARQGSAPKSKSA